MRCLLKSCAHAGNTNCKSLEMCGAEYALAEAIKPDGYLVHYNNNPTIDALKEARLVDLNRLDGRFAWVTAAK